MDFKKTAISQTPLTCQLGIYSVITLLLVGCSSSDNEGTQIETPSHEQQRVVIQGTDVNNIGSSLLSLNPDGPGGSPNQSLRSGDVLQSGATDSVLIGALGVDVLLGGDGDDVIIGGTEDFNSSVDGDSLGADNRDRAFGGKGDDIFIWAPGDGSDFYDGGQGIDVVAFGLLGEERDSDSGTNGAPFSMSIHQAQRVVKISTEYILTRIRIYQQLVFQHHQAFVRCSILQPIHQN